MMKKAVLLSMVAEDIEQARFSVESAVKSQFVAHQSDYRGGDYFRGEIDGVGLILQENFLEDDGEPTEAEYSEERLLLYLDGDGNKVDKLVATLVASNCAERELRSSSY